MKINVFDDKFSLSHIFIGILAHFSVFFFILFIFYEIVEFTYKNRKQIKEPVENFVGDIFEFFAGYSFINLTHQVLLWH